MDNFFDLKNSTVMRDMLLFKTFVDLLTRLYGVETIEKDKIYRYSTKMETESNHKLILDNWDVICLYGARKEYLKKAQRLVYSTLTHIVSSINSLYDFNNKVKFDYVRVIKRSSDDKKRVLTLTFYDLSFT